MNIVMTQATQTSEASVVNNVVQFSQYSSRQTPKVGWWCNLADNLNIAVQHPYILSIKKRAHSQYALICGLLKAGTCEKIFFDCDLSQAQAEYLGKLQRSSGTELIHARLAAQFGKEMA